MCRHVSPNFFSAALLYSFSFSPRKRASKMKPAISPFLRLVAHLLIFTRGRGLFLSRTSANATTVADVLCQRCPIASERVAQEFVALISCDADKTRQSVLVGFRMFFCFAAPRLRQPHLSRLGFHDNVPRKATILSRGSTMRAICAASASKACFFS